MLVNHFCSLSSSRRDPVHNKFHANQKVPQTRETPEKVHERLSYLAASCSKAAAACSFKCATFDAGIIGTGATGVTAAGALRLPFLTTAGATGVGAGIWITGNPALISCHFAVDNDPPVGPGGAICLEIGWNKRNSRNGLAFQLAKSQCSNLFFRLNQSDITS
jgi:hypothetical protein